ncbi:MAG TPA: beta-galactosidase trimerization domain-containing protein [Terriglobia bacterium]|nr:beta-galactosidase trimerization domain-containing protein [Terriglobia bacterium]
MKMSRSVIRSARIAASVFLTACCIWVTARSVSSAADAQPKSEKRIDAPFTMDVKTPHVAWAQPWAGNPVHALVVPSVSEGRTLAELAERFPITYDTVMIDTAWDVNTWTVGTGKNYEARNYKLTYQYLSEDLASSAHYDVIVLPSLFGWNRLPQEARDAILKRVQEGAGLVLIHPTTGVPAPGEPPVEQAMNIHAPEVAVAPGGKLWEVSPLIDCLSDQLDSSGHLHVLPNAVNGGAWKAVAESFITDNVPFDSFPAEYLKHYKYRLGPEAKLLVEGPEGEPIVATKMFGKGRVVALGYVNHGLSPDIDWNFLGKQDDHWWEYFYSLLGRSIMWAGGEDPQVRLLPLRVESRAAGAKTLTVALENRAPIRRGELSVKLVNQWGAEQGSVTKPVRLKRGSNRIVLDLPGAASAGRNDVDVILSSDGKRYAWGSVSFAVRQPVRIVSIITDKKFYGLGDRMQVTVRIDRSGAATTGGAPVPRKENLSGPAKVRVDLLDNRQRLVGTVTEAAPAAREGVIHAALPVGNYTTNIGWVRAALLGGDAAGENIIDQSQTRVEFVSLDRKFGAYELILPWYGPPSYEPWEPTLEEQFRKIGVTVVGRPQNNFKLIAEVNSPGFGVYWYRRKPYLEQKAQYLKTHDTKYLIREPDLSSPEWLDKLRAAIVDSMKEDEPYAPLAYYLADESSLTSYGDPLDFSWSKPTLAALRVWLRGQYSSLEALNTEWETDYKAWDDVMPLTTREAQAKGNYAGWMDHRTFMEQAFARALEVAAETVKAQDPGGLPSISGTQAPGPSNAVNWYLLDHVVGYLQPYSEDDQDDLHRSIHAGQILTGFTGYERFGAELRHELWHRLLAGQTGASLFWHYTALNADLTLTQQGRDLAALTNEFRNEGLALLLRGAERENCGIAVHYSLLSVRGHWITDGHIAPDEVSDGDKTSANLKRFHQDRTNWLEALRDAGYSYDFVTTEQIDKGSLASYKVLVLPDSIALSKAEVTAIREFVRRGGLLIADAQTGLMDGHARWATGGLLDDVLGVEHTNARAEAKDAGPLTLHASWDGQGMPAMVTPAEAELKVTSGKAGFSEGGTPFLIENSFGAGRAVTLNFWMSNYHKLRDAGKNGPMLKLLEHYLREDGAQPVADISNANGQRIGCSEIVGYRKGEVRYLAVLPGVGCRDAGPVTLRLPSQRYVYNLREHRLLGKVSDVQETLTEGEPLFLALSLEPLGSLRVTALGAGAGGSLRVKEGGAAAFRIQLSMPGGQSDFPEAVHVDVRNPDGKVLSYYGRNLSLEDGEARFSVALALDDRPGEWQVTVRGPYAHQTSSASFQVVN